MKMKVILAIGVIALFIGISGIPASATSLDNSQSADFNRTWVKKVHVTGTVGIDRAHMPILGRFLFTVMLNMWRHDDPPTEAIIEYWSFSGEHDTIDFPGQDYEAIIIWGTLAIFNSLPKLIGLNLWEVDVILYIGTIDIHS